MPCWPNFWVNVYAEQTWHELGALLYHACTRCSLPTIRLTGWRLVKQGQGRNGSYVSWGSQNKLGIACASLADSGWLLLDWRGGGRRVILWLNKATAELTERKKEDEGRSLRLRWLQGLIRREFKRRHMLLCKSTEPPRPPPLNNAHIATTLMLKLTLVRHVPHCICRAVRESVPRRETFVITKNLMARKSLLLFWRGSRGKRASSCWNPKASN